MKDTQTLEEQIQQLSAQFFAEDKFVLVDLACRKIGRDIAIQIFVDRPAGGITMEECSILNRSIAGELDKHNIIPEGFTLEVSSPGLDRPLHTPQDFKRAVNRPLRVYLKEIYQGRREHTGILRDVDAHAVRLDAAELKQEVMIPLGDIVKGVQIIE